MAWNNRQNPLVYQAFSDILKNKQLWVSIDRYGIMRPTLVSSDSTSTLNDQPAPESAHTPKKSENGQNGTNLIVKEDWKTKEQWLHWDLSPFHHGTSAAGFAPVFVPREELEKDYGGLRVQGLVTLTDCPVEVGGFHCVPGFAGDRFFNWGKENRETYGNRADIEKRNFVEVPEDDPMRREITKVPMRAGSLLIWNSQLPHGNFPNTSAKFRMVQYIKMIPSDNKSEFQPVLQAGKIPREEFFPDDFKVSDIGRKLFGLEPW